MDTLPGCTTRNARDNIRCWTFSGAIVSAVGVLWPIWLMVWNLIWQILGGIFFGMLSCVSGCNPCLCSISSGFACTSCCSSCLFPIGFLSEVSCGGSCAALGTAWVKILTFAGFTGAWYLFLGDLVFAAGLVLFAVTLGIWVSWCIDEKSTEKENSAVDKDESKSLMAEELTDLEANTGELKF